MEINKYSLKARSEFGPQIIELISMAEQATLNIRFIIDKRLKENYTKIKSSKNEEEILELMRQNSGILEFKKDYEKNVKEPLLAVCTDIYHRYSISAAWGNINDGVK